jgi:hypothetical protein
VGQNLKTGWVETKNATRQRNMNAFLTNLSDLFLLFPEIRECKTVTAGLVGPGHR